MPTESAVDDDADDPDRDRERVWLVERTYSDDEQNIVILVYATPDGSRYLRKERALTSFDDARDTTAAVLARESSLGDVDDPDVRERYAAEAERTREQYDPEDLI
ncbi:hypothetical protein [Halobellus rufus]|uniref:hypothetical protein n=1 Tax=Halobellus rufus TaxID=1448860 RepID=UPI0006788624|nr:hypothetical protein [Halobellus rufus]